MKLQAGNRIPEFAAENLEGRPLRLPEPDAPSVLVHLQFRRFAGCPICNYHLHGYARRHVELRAAGLREIVLFHSSAAEMRQYQAHLPFDCVADPGKRHYRAWGVETSWRASLHPAALMAGLRGFGVMGRGYDRIENGPLGLPADFLIAPDGRLLASHYGRHAYDNWSVDEVLRLAVQWRDCRAVGSGFPNP